MAANDDNRGPSDADDAVFLRRVLLALLVAGALVVLALVLWQLLDVLVVVFGAVLFATVLHAVADPIAAHTPLSRRWALPLAGAIVLLIFGGTAWLFHAQVSGEVTAALAAAQAGLPRLGEQLGLPGLAGHVSDLASRALAPEVLMGRVTTLGATLLGATANLLLMLFGGAYLAASPTTYRDGVVKMFPAGARPRVGSTLDASGRALKLWLLGQLFAMVATGLLTWLALTLIGVPSAAGLALIAGVLEFIPLVGPFLGALPAVLVAITLGLPAAAWTVVAFLVIQQVESNIVQPIVMREAVAIPPAVLLFAVLAFGALFGALGVVLAAPLTVVTFVAVKKLYVRETLGERTVVPGEK
jgi:predicted PurR-regulated permease PerM